VNIVFISLDDYMSLSERGTYTDVLRDFVKQGHYVCAVSPTAISNKSGVHHDGSLCDIIKPLIVNSQKTSFIKKGISVATMPVGIKRAIDSSNILQEKNFDLILYATPPVTIAPIVKYLKKKNRNAKTFLLLKDMWPQVAIDVGMLQDSGIKGVFSQILRKFERDIYLVSDKIGCMSPANVEYLKKHHPNLDNGKLLICPNSMEPFEVNNSGSDFRSKLGIGHSDIVLLYGGNLGKMQGIPFLCQCIKAAEEYEDIKIVVCGKGTEYGYMKQFFDSNLINNALLINGLPREEFEQLTSECDYGMVFLDWRATTPNFPSRILPYMNNSKPIIACTDTATDIGKVIQDNGFGWWTPSNDVSEFKKVLDRVRETENYNMMCKKSNQYLKDNYTAHKTTQIIIDAIS
jgi:glycosyltransferase involved in cell wall biosynthesis